MWYKCEYFSSAVTVLIIRTQTISWPKLLNAHNNKCLWTVHATSLVLIWAWSQLYISAMGDSFSICFNVRWCVWYKFTYCRAQPGCRASAAPCSSPPSPPSTALTQQEDPHLHTQLRTLTSLSCLLLWLCMTWQCHAAKILCLHPFSIYIHTHSVKTVLLVKGIYTVFPLKYKVKGVFIIQRPNKIQLQTI